MGVLLVAFENRDPQFKGYPDFLKTIQSYDWKQLSDSAYAIVADEEPGMIFEKLRRFQQEHDHLYVIALARPWRGRGLKSTNDWLDERL